MFAPFAGIIDRLKARSASRAGAIVADGDGVWTVGDVASSEFRWDDVAEIRTYKRDLGIVDEIRLAVRVGDSWHDFGEDTEGFAGLREALRERFPMIPDDWFGKVMHPAFATNETVLFLRTATPNVAPTDPR